VADKAIASTKIGFYFGTDGRVSGETDNQIVKITGISLKQAELKNTYTYALTAANLGAYLMYWNAYLLWRVDSSKTTSSLSRKAYSLVMEQ
jgi:hypothetical protein